MTTQTFTVGTSTETDMEEWKVCMQEKQKNLKFSHKLWDFPQVRKKNLGSKAVKWPWEK